MTVLLLACIQLLAPFVHGHAGAVTTGGWHLHPAAQAAGSALPPSAPTEQGVRAVDPPGGSDSPEVGIVTGIAQPRQTTWAGEPATVLGGTLLPGAGLSGAWVVDGGTRCLRRPASTARLDPHQSQPGMPALPHGPPRHA